MCITARNFIPTGRSMVLIALKCCCRTGLGVFSPIMNLAVLLASIPAMRGERSGL